MGKLQTATQMLDRNGFNSRPGWRALQTPHQHGWHFLASSTSENHFRETVVVFLKLKISCSQQLFKRSAHTASSQGHLRNPDTLARTPQAQLRSMGSPHPCQNLRGVPEARDQRIGQRCKPTECSSGGTMLADRLSCGRSLRDFAFAN